MRRTTTIACSIDKHGVASKRYLCYVQGSGIHQRLVKFSSRLVFEGHAVDEFQFRGGIHLGAASSCRWAMLGWPLDDDGDAPAEQLGRQAPCTVGG